MDDEGEGEGEGDGNDDGNVNCNVNVGVDVDVNINVNGNDINNKRVEDKINLKMKVEGSQGHSRSTRVSNISILPRYHLIIYLVSIYLGIYPSIVHLSISLGLADH